MNENKEGKEEKNYLKRLISLRTLSLQLPVDRALRNTRGGKEVW